MRLRSLLLFSAPLAVLAASVARPAAAQAVVDGEFNAQRFLPAPGPGNFLTVEGARTDGKMAFSLGLFGSYAENPIEATNVAGNQVIVTKSLITADLLASLTPIPNLQIGLVIPFSSASGDGIQRTASNFPTRAVGDASIDGLKASGLGDPMVELKARIAGEADGKFVFGGSAFATAPLGHAMAENGYIGDGSPTAGARLIGDLNLGILSLAGNVGGAYRKLATFGSSQVGSELRYGVAASVNAGPALRFIGEGFGSVGLDGKGGGANATEADLAAQITPIDSPITFTAGAGIGLATALGVPDKIRGFAGLSFNHAHRDQDGDGIVDERDQCPTAAEDVDGFQDDDGCPDPDNDGDKILDANDKCPNQPENLNNFQDDDGCPDEIPDQDKDGIPDAEDKCPADGGDSIVKTKGDFYGCPDRDKDGVPDKMDKCPDQAEDTDGFQDEDGCPDPDNDGDGILDQNDQCVDQPEVFNGFQDEDGCPDEVPDRDHDGIPDSKDKCPNAAETYNGFQDDDGCPDGKALLDVTNDEIKIKDVVSFAPDSDKIVGKPSFKLLDGIAAALAHHGEIFKIEVGGHTDNTGDDAHNTELSQKRAEAVKAYLVSKGINDVRLTAKGYGSSTPIADNKSKAGQAKNRRVEFKILSSTKKKADLDMDSPAPGATPAKPAAPGGAAAPPSTPGGSAPTGAAAPAAPGSAAPAKAPAPAAAPPASATTPAPGSAPPLPGGPPTPGPKAPGF